MARGNPRKPPLFDNPRPCDDCKSGEKPCRGGCGHYKKCEKYREWLHDEWTSAVGRLKREGDGK